MKIQATIENLYRVPENGKAELVNGELVLISPNGFWPSRAAGEIYVSLRDYARRTKSGYAIADYAIADNVGFLVDLPNRQSFSPDTAFFVGQPTGMKFLQGAPVFAVEVRSEGDYGSAAERTMAEKRADYLAAGTLVVWDVDLLGDDVIRVYKAENPDVAIVYRRGQEAEAEPAVPGWTFAVDSLFL